MKKTYQLRNRFFIIDVAAILVLATFAVGYYHICTHSINVVDESCYISFAHRFFLGDRPIVDDWHVAQMTGILLLLPFSVFYSVTHSTEGVVLFFRILYAVCQMLVTAYIYISLRIYGNKKYSRPWERRIFAFGALIAAVFACFIPACIPTLSYYAMSLMGLAVLSVTLFCYPGSKLKYFFCGTVFASIILAEPASIFLYLLLLLIFFATTLYHKISKKTPGQTIFFNNSFLFFNLGCYFVATPVATFLLYRCGFHTLVSSFHHLFDGNDYIFSMTDGNIINIHLYIDTISLYGGFAVLSLASITVLTAILHKYRYYTRFVFSIGLVAFYILAYTCFWKHGKTNNYVDNTLGHGIPLYLSGPAWMLLSKKADKKMCYAWGICTSFSVLFSISSNISIGWGGIAAGVFSVILATQVLMDVMKDISEKNKKTVSIITACTVLCSLAFVFCNEIKWFETQNVVFFVENMVSQEYLNQKLDVKLNEGPLRGIYTKQMVAAKYKDMIQDLKKMKDLTKPDDSVFVCNLAPWYYLYLDRDYATYTTWFRKDEFSRLKQYWHEHPDKIPEYIYFPYFNMYSLSIVKSDLMERKEKLNQLVEYDSIWRGEAGEIWHVPKIN